MVLGPLTAPFILPYAWRLFGDTLHEVRHDLGLMNAVWLVVGDYVFYPLGSPLSLFASDLPPWWYETLTSISAGIGEELLRLFSMTGLTPLFIVRALSLNELAGIALGGLEGKRGLGTAMGARIMADVFIYGLLPMLL